MIWQLDFLLLGSLPISACSSVILVQVFRFHEEPEKVIHSDIGQNLSLRWSLGKTNETMVMNNSKDQKSREFLFGEWSFPGYISNKILLVRDSVILTRQSYEEKFTYKGNLSNDCNICTAEIKLFNVTHADFKTYGVSLFIYPYASPLQSQLTVARRVPAKIIKWSSEDHTIHEGNATNISCEAEGQPLPSVIIQLAETETVMARGKGAVKWKVERVKPEHEGTYHCVVYQDDVESERKTMSLKVISSSRNVKGELPTTTNSTTMPSAAKWTKALYSTILTCLVVNQYVSND